MQFFTFVSALIVGSKLAEVSKAQVSFIADSSFILPAKEKGAIMMLSNGLRSTISPAPIKMNGLMYNYSLEAKINSFLNAKSPDWVFQNSSKYYNAEGGPKNNWNGFVMFQYPEFKAWEPYCKFWVHDTMDDIGSVLQIFRMRLHQKNCFDWTSCINKPQLSYFQSCVRQTVQCSYSSEFLVRMLLNFDSVAVVGINHKGPYTPYPKTQLLSFWGWGCASGGVKDIPDNGRPYEAGYGRASQCDGEHPVVSKGLCYRVT